MAVVSYTVDDLHRMVRAGTLAEDARVELLDGQIVPMTPIGIPHAACVRRLERLFAPLARRAATLGAQSPLQLALGELPQPDLAVLAYQADGYATRYPAPADTFLVIEVADTSLVHDRDEKLPRYAASGVVETWLVNLPDDCLVIYRQPVNGTYRDIRTARRSDTIAPLAFPDLTLAVSEILG